jgi:hypothetical protein
VTGPAAASPEDDKPFHPKPGTDDEWCAQFLDLMSVERHPNVFLLGERLSLVAEGALCTQSARAAYNPHFSATQRFTI